MDVNYRACNYLTRRLQICEKKFQFQIRNPIRTYRVSFLKHFFSLPISPKKVGVNV